NKYSIEDRYTDDNLKVTDTYMEAARIDLSKLLDAYWEVKPTEAEVIEVMLEYSAEGYQKKDLTLALANFYGSDKYTGAIQKRVSRVREDFKKFVIQNGYYLNF
ncbi:hypothetical protein, partial [Pseudoalteromonas sp. SIMBA_162]|uniref:hypothetical protein n=1 Tax=Pseudoalteromonas sp. SIMBA_162 TaxID=3080867 RepID=UPI00397E4FD3